MMSVLRTSSKEAVDGYPPFFFVDDREAPVALIEVTSHGVSRRYEVNEKLVEDYIGNDYEVRLPLT
jgi:hypothetical protein